MIEAAANRIATPNAATPRYGQCNRQALQLFELLACNGKTFLLGDLKGAILFHKREWPPLDPPRERKGLCPLTPHIGSLDLEELHALRNQVRCTWLRHESSASRDQSQPRLTIVRRE